jgi:hypothetical protein
MYGELAPTTGLILSFNRRADPPRMKPCDSCGPSAWRSTISLVQVSPILSWTVGPWSTPDCRQSAQLAVEHAY